MDSLQEPYNLVLVDDPAFLALGNHVKTPVVHLRRQAAVLATGSTSQGHLSSRLLDAASDKFEPIIVETLSRDDTVLAEAIRLLEQASASLDPLEPFQRIRRALERVHAERVLESK